MSRKPDVFTRLDYASAWVRGRTDLRPDIGVVLGSGLGPVADGLADAVAIGYAGVGLVSYMSTLTSLGYTATQYALLTSAMALTGKFLKGFSGVIVDALQHGRTADQAYAVFYLIAAGLGLPAIILCLILARRPAPPPVT